MSRFFVQGRLRQGAQVSIGGRDLHHLRDVLKFGQGDKLILWDATGKEHTGVVSGLGARQATVQVLEEREARIESPLKVTLCQAVAKGDKMDMIIQKATELGAVAVVPFFSLRTVPRFSGEWAASKAERWRRIAYEAAKQCGRVSVPRVSEPTDYPGALCACREVSHKLILWEEEREQGLRETLRKMEGSQQVAVMVGPEGGFTPEEVSQALAEGFWTVTVGRRILRTETAGIVVLSILQYELGDIG